MARAGGAGAAVLVVASSAALVWHDAWQDEQLRLRDRQADRVLAALDESRLDALSGFLLGSALVEDDGRLPAESFQRLSAAVLAEERATTVSFVEIVDDGDRAAWEERGGRSVEEFRGTDRVLAARRDRYHVVSAVAPDEPLFTQAVGVDLATSRVFGPAVRAAVETGEPTMTGRQVWGSTGDTGFGIAVPLQDSAGRVVALLVPTYRAETLAPAVETALAREGTGVRVSDAGEVLLEIGDVGPVAEVRELRHFGRAWSVTTTFERDPSPAWSPVLLGGVLAPAAGWVSWQRSRREREREALLARERSARADADRSTSLLVRVNDVAGRFAEAGTVARVAALAAEQGCDAVGATRSVAMIRTGDRLRIVAARGYPEAVVERYRTVPVDLPTAVPHVLRDATPLWIESAEEYEALFPEYGEEYRRLGHEAGVFLPLPGPGGAEGVLVYHFTQRRTFAAPERQALEILAAQMAATITRLSALERERAARGLSEALRRHAEQLATAVRPRDVASVVLDLLADNGAEVASLHHIAGGGDVVLGARGTGPAPPPDARHPTASGHPVTGQAVPLRGATGRVTGALVIAARRPWPDTLTAELVTAVADQAGTALERALLHSETEAAARDAALLAALGDALERPTDVTGRAAAVEDVLTRERAWSVRVDLTRDARPEDGADVRSAVLAARGRRLGVLTVRAREDGSDPLPPAELLDHVCARAALALDSATRYEHERDVSHALQRGILGPGPARIDGVVTGHLYQPGSAALQVGGDWFDVFRTVRGTTAIVVGDVVGHDLRAALAMSQLRGAVRALFETGGPARVLATLDDVVEWEAPARFSTVACAELDAATGRLAYACAGHLPPALVTGAGVELLWGGRSTPLGVRSTRPREEAHETIAPNGTLWLYTDGLVERRGETLHTGLRRLTAAVAEAHGDVQHAVDAVAKDLLHDAPHEDDVCVVAVRRLPPASRAGEPDRARR